LSPSPFLNPTAPPPNLKHTHPPLLPRSCSPRRSSTFYLSPTLVRHALLISLVFGRSPFPLTAVFPVRPFFFFPSPPFFGSPPQFAIEQTFLSFLGSPLRMCFETPRPFRFVRGAAWPFFAFFTFRRKIIFPQPPLFCPFSHATLFFYPRVAFLLIPPEMFPLFTLAFFSVSPVRSLVTAGSCSPFFVIHFFIGQMLFSIEFFHFPSYGSSLEFSIRDTPP